MRGISMNLALLLVAGCAADAEDQKSAGGQNTGSCISHNPAAEPFDVGQSAFLAPTRAPGSSAPATPAPTAASIAEECRSNGGTGCDPSAFISKSAAECIASLNHFEAGLEPWITSLVYNSRFGTVVWSVMSKLHDAGNDGYSGALLALDASDGTVLDTTAYSVIP